MGWSWDWGYVNEIMPRMLEGLKVTVTATLLTFAVAATLGFVLAMLKRSRRRVVSAPTHGASEFVRRTPELVQLYFVFYVLPDFGLTLAALTAGVVTLGVHYSTYVSEIYRAGIESVPRGQWDAATALSLPTVQKWRKVVLPQAIPNVLPALGSLLILMFKQTALLAAITVQELLNTGQQIGSETFNYVEPLIVAGFLYLVISYTAGLGVRALERRAAHA
jgi:polar amino acid transport system permease protein